MSSKKELVIDKQKPREPLGLTLSRMICQIENNDVSREQIKEQLSDILSGKGRDFSTYHENFALNALKANPEWAKEKFPTPGTKFAPTVHPFVSLLYHGASLTVLKEVYEMFPPVLMERDDDKGLYLLSWTLRWRTVDSTRITFVAKNYLKPLRDHVLRRGILFQMVKSRFASKETQQVLIDLIYLVMDDKKPDSVFLTLVGYSAADDIVDHAIEIISSKSDKLSLEQVQGPITLQHSKALKKLLPFVREFTCQCMGFDKEGLLHFLDFMRNLKSTHRLELSIKSMEIDQDVLDALELLFKRNDALLQFSCLFDNEMSNMDECLRSISKGLSHNKTVKEIRLKNFHFTSPVSLNSLLCVETLETVTLDDFRCEETELLTNDDFNLDLASDDKAEQVSLKALHLRNFLTMPDIPLSMLLRQATMLPMLEELHVSIQSGEKDVDFTDIACEFLNQGRLKKLELSGLKVKCDKVCDCLKKNKSLVWYKDDGITIKDENAFVEMLAEHNTTLEVLGTLTSSPFDGLPFSEKALNQISFYTMLNSFGRGKCGEITTSEFVGLLSVPIAFSCPYSKNETMPDDMLENQNSIDSESDTLSDCKYDGELTAVAFKKHDVDGKLFRLPSYLAEHDLGEQDSSSQSDADSFSSWSGWSSDDSDGYESDETFYWDEDEDLLENKRIFTDQEYARFDHHVHVVMDGMLQFEEPCEHHLRSFNVQYGLLRRLPALWLENV